MFSNVRQSLADGCINASAPCRVDLGGTLDISTFYLPLQRLAPCTFNIAVGLRTEVRLTALDNPQAVEVASRGIGRACCDADRLPFSHPLGLMFAVAAYFGAAGIRIEIDSASPPRSAMGGSSAAAVALVAALHAALHPETPSQGGLPVRDIALLAHSIEAAVAGVPCGLQDQLAAAFGGVNAWRWTVAGGTGDFSRTELTAGGDGAAALQDHLLLAYCGVPHRSKDVNGRWVEAFLDGRYRSHWEQILSTTRRFITAWQRKNWAKAVGCMQTELALRCEMTPDVLDPLGRQLCDSAADFGCGARFAGAGAGGCIWALGEPATIARLRPQWEKIVAQRETACLLPFSIDTKGVTIDDQRSQGTASAALPGA